MFSVFILLFFSVLASCSCWHLRVQESRDAGSGRRRQKRNTFFPMKKKKEMSRLYPIRAWNNTMESNFLNLKLYKALLSSASLFRATTSIYSPFVLALLPSSFFLSSSWRASRFCVRRETLSWKPENCFLMNKKVGLNNQHSHFDSEILHPEFPSLCGFFVEMKY